VIVDLDGRASRVLQAWATAHGLRVRWFVGRSVAELSATPAGWARYWGPTLMTSAPQTGKGFMLPRPSPGCRPPLPRGERGGAGERLSGISSAYVGSGGLNPSGLLQAYDADPLRALGYNGAGETVVAFEIDNYVTSDLNTFSQSTVCLLSVALISR